MNFIQKVHAVYGAGLQTAIESLEPRQAQYVEHLLDMFMKNKSRNITPYRMKTAYREVFDKEDNGYYRKRFHAGIEEIFREHGLTLDFLTPKKKSKA